MINVSITPEFKDQHEYDDVAYAKASVNVSAAIEELVEAGATSANVENEVANGLANAGVS